MDIITSFLHPHKFESPPPRNELHTVQLGYKLAT